MAQKTENRRINVFLNNKMIGVTPQEMRKEYRLLQNELGKLQKGSKEYNQKIKELQLVNKNLTEHREKIAGISRSWQQVKSVAAGVVGGQVMVTGLNKVLSFIPDMIRRNAELSDSFADVMKTTGMTREEVQALSKDLKGIDTRTSRKDLLELAYVAGKLGNQGRDDVMGFVRAADKINVALGKDLGKDAVITIGKLVNIFGLKQQFGLEEGMLKIASTMNELGMASEASEGFLAEFMKRLGGIMPLVKMTAAEGLALGATLDALGQTSEVSSTALSKLFLKMAKDAEEFAKFAEMSGPEFRQLMERDFNGAFIKVLEGVKKSSNGVNELASTLGELGVDGGRIIGVLGSLANNTDRLAQQTDIANKAFAEGSSVLDEFNIKNENLAAIQEKIGKRMAEIWSNSAILRGVENLSRAFYNMITPELSQNMEKDRLALRRLELQIYNTNTPAEKRIEIIEELKRKYPDLLGFIDSEKVSNEELAKSLQKVNEQTVNQIILQEEREKMANFEKQIMVGVLKDIIDKEEKVQAAIIKLTDQTGLQIDPKAGSLVEQASDLLEKVNEFQRSGQAGSQGAARMVSLTSIELRQQLGYLEGLMTKQKIANVALGRMGEKFAQLKERLGLLDINTDNPGNPNTESAEETALRLAKEKADAEAAERTANALKESEKAKIQKLGDEALKEYEKLITEVQKKSDEIFYATLPDTDQALIKMSAHYDALRAQAAQAITANAADPSINGTERALREQEILDQIKVINQTHDAEMDAYYAQVASDRNAKRAQYAEELWLMSQSELDQEIARILQDFDEKTLLYEQYGLDITTLVKATEDKINAIKAKARKEDLENQSASNKKLLEEQRQVTIQQIQLLSEAANFANEMYTWMNSGSAAKTRNEIAHLEELQRAHANDEAYQKAVAKEIAILRKKEAEDQRMAAEFAITMNTIAAVSSGIAKAMQTSTTIYEAIALGLGMMATVGSAMAQVQALNNNASTPSYNSYAIGTGFGGHSSRAMVGEMGPEIVDLPVGAAVYTASRSVEIAKWNSAPTRSFNPDVFDNNNRNSTAGNGYTFTKGTGSAMDPTGGGGDDDLTGAVLALVKKLDQNSDKRVTFVQKDYDEFKRRDSVVKAVGTLSKS